MRLMIGVVAVAALAACSQEAPRAPATTEAPATTNVAGLTLSPLAGEETRGRLGGELGCSFVIGRDVYVLAMGNVDAAAVSEALVKRNGVVTQVAATAPGGFGTLEDGESFAGEGLDVEVRVGARNETGNESVEHAATLIARDAAGERSYEGLWSCGP